MTFFVFTVEEFTNSHQDTQNSSRGNTTKGFANTSKGWFGMKLRKLVEWGFGLLIAFILVACAPGQVPQAVLPMNGEITLLANGGTSYGLQQVLRNAPGTFVAVKNQMVICIWSTDRDGVAILAFDLRNGTTILNSIINANNGRANLMNGATFKDFREFLAQDGWTLGKFGELPGVIAVALGKSIQTYGSVLGRMTVLVLPLMWLNDTTLTPQPE